MCMNAEVLRVLEFTVSYCTGLNHKVTALEWFYMSSLHNVFCSSAVELTEIRTKYVHGNRLAALMHAHRLWYTWSSKLNTNVHSNNSL